MTATKNCQLTFNFLITSPHNKKKLPYKWHLKTKIDFQQRKYVQLTFQPLILHMSNIKLTVHKGESIPWLWLFPNAESLSPEGGGGGLGGVSLGNGGINLQLSSAGSNIVAFSKTGHGQFSKIPIIL